jgi:hypothetical protein
MLLPRTAAQDAKASRASIHRAKFPRKTWRRKTKLVMLLNLENRLLMSIMRGSEKSRIPFTAYFAAGNGPPSPDFILRER